MSDCRFCGCRGQGNVPGDRHALACPMFGKKLDTSKEVEWEAGWNHGRDGAEAMNPAQPVYMLGYRKGEAALEEAQNGHDPRFA